MVRTFLIFLIFPLLSLSIATCFLVDHAAQKNHPPSTIFARTPPLGMQQGSNPSAPDSGFFQDGSERFRGGGRGRGEPASNRSDYPMWEIEKPFQKDVFTFVRVQYDSRGGRGGGFGGWRNDFPDCDWNFSVRLQQLTSFRVDPNGLQLRLDDTRLFDYPFVFMTNLGTMALSPAEIQGLRRYLHQGGFLMADDFWAAAEWAHIREVMKEVLPDQEPRELTLDHEIFHNVYNLAKLPQVPSIRAWQRGMTYEDWHGPFENGDTSPHFWGYFDTNNRLVGLFCHNNDIADGWEREGEDEEYFERYSMKTSYPFGINIVTYAMSH
ncbi:MAG: DUF4159 domain-containing protein [Pirellulales bacterium]